MSYFTGIQYNDSGSLDAFSRLRISSTKALFTVQSQYDANPLQMEGGATGTGVAPTWDSSTRMVAISGTTGTGVSFYQSYQYSPYEPGRSQFIAMTGVLGTGIAGWVADYGYGDAANGIFYRQNGATNLQFVQRSSTSGSPVETVVAQSSWNIDKMDGTGSSGITLDVTKAFILIIDLQFLGMGRVRLGFDINGIIYYCHQFLNANILTVPYMQQATLPVSVTLTGTSTGAGKTCYFKCATVQSEGGNLSGFGYPFSTPMVGATAGNATRVPILSIRPKTTFGGITNRSLFILDAINLFVQGNQDVFWELATGVTLTAPTWANVNTANSSFEYTSVPGTGTAAGIVLASGFMSRLGGTNNGSSIDVSALASLHNPIALNRAGATTTANTLTLFVTGLAGTAACQASLNFHEIR